MTKPMNKDSMKPRKYSKALKKDHLVSERNFQKELFVRWLETAIETPILQLGNLNCDPITSLLCPSLNV